MNADAALHAPLRTLTESLELDFQDHISTHDIQEAYSLLSLRALSSSVVITDTEIVTRCLLRDIPSALTHPFTLKHAIDLASLSHYAIQLLADIFSIPTMYSVFSNEDLHDLFNSLLSLSNTPTHAIPTPTPHKTRAIVIYALRVQCLPLSLLSLHADKLFLSFRLALSPGNVETAILDALKAVQSLLQSHPETFISSTSDILPDILSLLLSSSTATRTEATHTLGRVALTSLSNPTSALALSKHINPFLRTHYSNPLLSPPSPPNISLQLLAAFASLAVISVTPFSHPYLIRALVPTLNHARTHCSSAVRAAAAGVWMCLLSAFVRLLINDKEEEKEREERVFHLIKQAPDIGVGRALVCILLAHSQGRIVTTGPPQESQEYRRDPEIHTENFTRALIVLCGMARSASRRMRSDCATLLELLLLPSKVPAPIGVDGQPPLARPHPNHEDPVHVPWDPTALISAPLLDGRWATLPPRVSAAASPIIKGEVRYPHVRSLSNEEIRDNFDALVNVWRVCVEGWLTLPTRPPENDGDKEHGELDLPEILVRVWNRLLAQSGCIGRVGELLMDILRVSVHEQRDDPTKDAKWKEEVTSRLLLVHHLWRVARTIYPPGELSEQAAIVLRVLRHIGIFCYDEMDDGNETWEKSKERKGTKAWEALCSDVIPVAGLRNVAKSHEVCEAADKVDAKIWTIATHAFVRAQQESQGLEGDDEWEDIVEFLTLPFRSERNDKVTRLPSLNAHELELWDALLRTAVSRAGVSSVGSSIVVDTLARKIYFPRDSEEPPTSIANKEAGEMTLSSGTVLVNALALPPQAAASLLAHADLTSRDAPPPVLCVLLEHTLCILYSTGAANTHAGVVTELLHAMRDAIEVASSVLIVPLLTALRKGLSMWIEDKAEVFTDEEYNNVIVPLYCAILSALPASSTIPASSPTTSPTLTILVTLEDVLAAGFVRVPPPADAPLAFAKWWRAACAPFGAGALKGRCPMRVEACVRALEDAWGTELGLGLVLGASQSQSQDSDMLDSQASDASIIPDSQPSKPSPNLTACLYEFGGPSTWGPPPISPENAPSFPSLSSPLALLNRNISTNFGPVPKPPSMRLNALEQLGDYGETQNFVRCGTPSPTSTSTRLLSSLPPQEESPLAGRGHVVSLKRAAPVTHTARLVKRARKSPHPEPKDPSPDLEDQDELDSIPRSPQQALSIGTSDSNQKSKGKRKRGTFDGVEVPLLGEVLKRWRSSSPAESRPSSQPHPKPATDTNCKTEVPRTNHRYRRPILPTSSPRSVEDDYDSWEVGMNTPDVQHVQRKLSISVSIDEVPETEAYASPPEGKTRSEPAYGEDALPSIDADDDDDMDSVVLESPSLGAAARRARRSRQASQPMPTPGPLRRTRTASKLDTLQDVYALVENGGSQLPVRDLVRATRLVHKIGSVLTEKMSKKLGDRG